MELITGNGVTITLKEITDMIEVEHNKALKKVEKLAEEPKFGTLAKVATVYNDKGQTIDTYLLNEKQAVAVAAKLKNSMLMKVIVRLEQLEKQKNGNALAQLSEHSKKLEAMFQYQEAVGDVLTEHETRLKVIEQNRRLETWQERKLQDEKNSAVYRIAQDDKELTKKLHQRIWHIFKKRYHLPRYNELPLGKFDDAVSYLRNITITDCL